MTSQYSQTPINRARQRSSVGLIVRQKEPANLETPFDQIDSYLTQTELFYVRSHFTAPKLNSDSYRLQVDGAVRNPFSLNYRDLRDMPFETRIATLECAGNGRVYLVPTAPGAQWAYAVLPLSILRIAILWKRKNGCATVTEARMPKDFTHPPSVFS